MRGALARNGLLILTVLLCGGAVDSVRFALPGMPAVRTAPNGHVLFLDDFSGNLAQWQPDREGVWSVWHGMLRADLPDQRQLRSLIYAGSEDWHDVALDFDVCMMRGVDKGAVVRVQGQSGLGVDLRGGVYQDVVMYLREWPLGKASVVNANTVWHHVRIEARGDRFRVYVNGDLRLDRTDVRRPQGRIALAAYTGGTGQCTVYYDNVVVTELK